MTYNLAIFPNAALLGAAPQSGNAAGWLAALAAVAVLAWYASTQRRRGGKPDLYQPRKLFDDLCKLHRLSRGDIMLLHALAKERQLDFPGLLFVHPEHFTSDVRHDDDDGYAEALGELHRRLFGEPEAASVG